MIQRATKKVAQTSKKYLITINNEYIFTQKYKLINIFSSKIFRNFLSLNFYTELNKKKGEMSNKPMT
jgi:hypothetical protein